MQRNLDHRIEVVVPVEAAHARGEIESIFKALLADNTQAWELARATASWVRVEPEKSERRALGAGRLHAAPRPRALAFAPALSADRWPVIIGRCVSGSSTSGSNTVRLLVADGDDAVEQRRAVLGLGESIERDGAIPEPKLAAVGRLRRGVRRGRAPRAAPSGSRCSSRARAGRRRTATSCSSGSRRPRASRCGCSPASEEGRLAFLGAVARTRGLRNEDGRGLRRRRRLGAGHGRHAGRRRGVDALDRRRLAAAREPLLRRPTRRAPARCARARAEVARLLDGFAPAAAEARPRGRRQRPLAPRRSSARRSARDELERALALLADTPADELAATYGLDPGRTSTLAAGAVILAALQDAPRHPAPRRPRRPPRGRGARARGPARRGLTGSNARRTACSNRSHVAGTSARARTAAPVLELDDPAGGDRRALVGEAAHALLGDDGVLVGADDVLEVARGADDGGELLPAGLAGELGGVPRALRLDPERGGAARRAGSGRGGGRPSGAGGPRRPRAG